MSDHTPAQLAMLMARDGSDIRLPPGAVMVPGRSNIVRVNNLAEGLALSASIKRQRELESSK